tara:strand:- start:305 stop:1630 length:1326 start_codon:yes stop_codon:yes gene_type:complete
MHDIAFVISILNEKIEGFKKSKSVVAILSLILAGYLWSVNLQDASYIAGFVCLTVALRVLGREGLSKTFARKILPITLICLSPILSSLVYSVIYINLEKIKSQNKWLASALLGSLIILQSTSLAENIIYAIFALGISTVFIISNFKRDNLYQMIIWICVQLKVLGANPALELTLPIKIISISIFAAYAYLIWATKIKRDIWIIYNKSLLIMLWFSMLQFGQVGFWGTGLFIILVNEIFKENNLDEKESILKIKTFALAAIVMLPVSLPMFLLIYNHNIASMLTGSIMSLALFVLSLRWLMILNNTKEEVIIDKWLLLDLLIAFFAMAYLTYFKVQDNIPSLIAFTSISLITTLLFVFVKIDKILNKLKFDPRINKFFKSSDPSVSENIISQKTISGPNIVIETGESLRIILLDLFEFVDRTFIVFFVIICTLVLIIGGVVA